VISDWVLAIARNLRDGPRRVDAPLTLAPQLDRLADVESVPTLLLRLAGFELLSQEIHRRIGPQGRGDLSGFRRGQRSLLRPQRRVLPEGELKGVVHGDPTQRLLANDDRRYRQGDYQTEHANQRPAHWTLPAT
jgi:hypothetical protein